MTDLEAVKLCAEAMGWKHLGAIGVQLDEAERYSARELDEKYKGRLWCLSGGNDWWINPEGHSVCAPCSGIPNPLEDDAQAMALVKRFHLHIDQRPGKHVTVQDPHFAHLLEETSDLNRAIVRCVAAMHRATLSKSVYP